MLMNIHGARIADLVLIIDLLINVTILFTCVFAHHFTDSNVCVRDIRGIKTMDVF